MPNIAQDSELQRLRDAIGATAALTLTLQSIAKLGTAQYAALEAIARRHPEDADAIMALWRIVDSMSAAVSGIAAIVDPTPPARPSDLQFAAFDQHVAACVPYSMRPAKEILADIEAASARNMVRLGVVLDRCRNPFAGEEPWDFNALFVSNPESVEPNIDSLTAELADLGAAAKTLPKAN